MRDIALISDINAEAGINSTFIAHPSFSLHYDDILKPSYYYDVFNGCILWAIQELVQNGIENIDAINLSNVLHSNRAVKKKISEYNITDISTFIQMSQFAARHTIEEVNPLVNRVITMALKRDLYNTSNTFQEICFKDDYDLKKVNESINTQLNALTEKYVATDDISLFGDKVDGLWGEIVARRTDDGIYGLPSKFPILSEYFTYEPGELVLLSARMKRGKSAFFLNECVHKLKNGVPTLYIDTEMGDRLFMERMLANLSGVEVKRIKRGLYGSEEERALRDALAWLKKQSFVHVYLPQTTDEEVYSINKLLKYRMDLGFVIFDYIKSNTASTGENSNILGQKVDFLKNRIAGELNLPVLAGAQLGRENQVADSDKIERYASTSVLWREKSPEELDRDGVECGNFCMNVSLNRNGEQMAEDEWIDMAFDGNRMRITQAKQHSNDPFANGYEL